MKIFKQSNFKDIQILELGYSPIGKPYQTVFCYYLDGLQIDTGLSKLRKEVTKVFNSQHVEKVILTHHHEDHSGNAILFQEKGIPIYAHSIGLPILKIPPKISPIQWLLWGKSDSISALDMPEIIETNRYKLQPYYTPGHAIDHLCFHEKKEGWLFAGDLYVSDYIKYFMRSESIKQQIDSIKKVLTLDFDVILCGHNPQFKTGKKRFKNKLQFFEDYYGKVVALHKKGYSSSAIMNTLALKEKRLIKFVSGGNLSAENMIHAVIRDEMSS